jgi:hypothetical protein
MLCVNSQGGISVSKKIKKTEDSVKGYRCIDIRCGHYQECKDHYKIYCMRYDKMYSINQVACIFRNLFEEEKEDN